MFSREDSVIKLYPIITICKKYIENNNGNNIKKNLDEEIINDPYFQERKMCHSWKWSPNIFTMSCAQTLQIVEYSAKWTVKNWMIHWAFQYSTVLNSNE